MLGFHHRRGHLAPDIAKRLGISQRTVYRDLAVMRDAWPMVEAALDDSIAEKVA